MRTSIATVSISGDFQEKLGAIAAAGFDGIEIFETDLLTQDRPPEQVGRQIRDAGLEITLYQPFRDFEGMPPDQRQRGFDRAERKFDLMQALGTDLMLICSNVSPVSLGGIDRAAADLRELGERAAARGLRVGFEALAWGRHINDHRDAWEVVRRADHASVGLILDSFHTLARGIDVETIRSIPGDRIFIVQLADAPKIDMDLLYWSRHFRNMPGQGDLDVTGFMRAVAATGYDGPVSLEIFNDQFRAGSPRVVAVDGRRSLLNLMDRVRDLEPGIAIDVPPMPPRAQAKGVEFIEFAADETEAEELAAMFRSLGFAPAGRHVSKEVTLWRQGDINLVINSEREGFAHAAYIAHGTCVCDIGLKVGDAQAAVERAEALGASIFRQPSAPGELEIPAIRGVGGGVMRFIDAGTDLGRVWEIEFHPLPGVENSPPGAGLTRIDHIAQTMNYEEMLTWVLYYTALFDTAKAPMVDVVDPAGIVRSQAIENADGSLRVTLNGAESHKTLAGRFIAESFGSAVQHVAFETEDIFSTADRLNAQGFAPLAISENYYADLGARFGLEDAMLEALRTRNILYDRDDGGAFFQLYSQSYGERFFFEIVERRGGYNGYGAPNAPFRIAAQKKAARTGAMPRG